MDVTVEGVLDIMHGIKELEIAGKVQRAEEP
jgi:hypothetical protein